MPDDYILVNWVITGIKGKLPRFVITAAGLEALDYTQDPTIPVLCGAFKLDPGDPKARSCDIRQPPELPPSAQGPR